MPSFIAQFTFQVYKCETTNTLKQVTPEVVLSDGGKNMDCVK